MHLAQTHMTSVMDKKITRDEHLALSNDYGGGPPAGIQASWVELGGAPQVPLTVPLGVLIEQDEPLDRPMQAVMASCGGVCPC